MNDLPRPRYKPLPEKLPSVMQFIPIPQSFFSPRFVSKHDNRKARFVLFYSLILKLHKVLHGNSFCFHPLKENPIDTSRKHNNLPL